MSDYKDIMRQIAEEFPLSEADRPADESGSGKWTEDMVAELLGLWPTDHVPAAQGGSAGLQPGDPCCPIRRALALVS